MRKNALIKSGPAPFRFRSAFTLIELLVVLAIIGVLTSLLAAGVARASRQGKISASTSNLRQLSTATLAYAVDHRGNFPPGMSRNNLVRWHGSRASISDPFLPENGYLTSYLGDHGKVNTCPLLDGAGTLRTSFEEGAGGYGYNSAYLGGTYPDGVHAPFNSSGVSSMSRLLMFTTTALANRDGVQEYPFTEPYQSRSGYSLQPSTHFRADGNALAAWGDGRVSREPPNRITGPNYYGGDNEKEHIGWFGPDTENGFWNPLHPH